MKYVQFILLVSWLMATSSRADVVISTSSISATEADGTITLSIDIYDTMSSPTMINTADLAIAIGDGGTALGGTDPITILDLDFSTGLFGTNADSIYGAPSPAFGNGAVVRGVQSSSGVQLTSSPQRLATLTLGNLTAGDYSINLNAANLTEVGRSGDGAISGVTIADSGATRLNVSAVPEPSGFLFLGLVSMVAVSRRRYRAFVYDP